jgi:hypothetical protein
MLKLFDKLDNRIKNIKDPKKKKKMRVKSFDYHLILKEKIKKSLIQ